MPIDPQINAERQAARKNRQLEQRYPLLHHTRKRSTFTRTAPSIARSAAGDY